jgi:hypothetical protein
LLAFVYPDTFAISFPSDPITFTPSGVYQPSNVHVLVTFVDETDVAVPFLNVIVYTRFGFVIDVLNVVESYVAFTLFVPAVVAY